MDFGDALSKLRDGQKVTREGWNGKGMYLRLVSPYIDFKINDAYVEGRGIEGTLLPWIGMKAADNAFVPWTPSQRDLLASDWELKVGV